MSGFFRRFFLSDFGPTPPPDVADRPWFPSERIVEMIYSEYKRERAIITVDQFDLYRIYTQWWDTGDWKDGHGAFWHGYGSNSHTDSINTARDLAAEALACPRNDG